MYGTSGTSGTPESDFPVNYSSVATAWVYGGLANEMLWVHIVLHNTVVSGFRPIVREIGFYSSPAVWELTGPIDPFPALFLIIIYSIVLVIFVPIFLYFDERYFVKTIFTPPFAENNSAKHFYSIKFCLLIDKPPPPSINMLFLVCPDGETHFSIPWIRGNDHRKLFHRKRNYCSVIAHTNNFAVSKTPTIDILGWRAVEDPLVGYPRIIDPSFEPIKLKMINISLANLSTGEKWFSYYDTKRSYFHRASFLYSLTPHSVCSVPLRKFKPKPLFETTLVKILRCHHIFAMFVPPENSQVRRLDRFLMVLLFIISATVLTVSLEIYSGMLPPAGVNPGQEMYYMNPDADTSIFLTGERGYFTLALLSSLVCIPLSIGLRYIYVIDKLFSGKRDGARDMWYEFCSHRVFSPLNVVHLPFMKVLSQPLASLLSVAIHDAPQVDATTSAKAASSDEFFMANDDVSRRWSNPEVRLSGKARSDLSFQKIEVFHDPELHSQQPSDFLHLQQKDSPVISDSLRNRLPATTDLQQVDKKLLTSDLPQSRRQQAKSDLQPAKMQQATLDLPQATSDLQPAKKRPVSSELLKNMRLETLDMQPVNKRQATSNLRKFNSSVSSSSSSTSMLIEKDKTIRVKKDETIQSKNAAIYQVSRKSASRPKHVEDLSTDVKPTAIKFRGSTKLDRNDRCCQSVPLSQNKVSSCCDTSDDFAYKGKATVIDDFMASTFFTLETLKPFFFDKFSSQSSSTEENLRECPFHKRKTDEQSSFNWRDDDTSSLSKYDGQGMFKYVSSQSRSDKEDLWKDESLLSKLEENSLQSSSSTTGNRLRLYDRSGATRNFFAPNSTSVHSNCSLDDDTDCTQCSGKAIHEHCCDSCVFISPSETSNIDANKHTKSMSDPNISSRNETTYPNDDYDPTFFTNGNHVNAEGTPSSHLEKAPISNTKNKIKQTANDFEVKDAREPFQSTSKVDEVPVSKRLKKIGQDDLQSSNSSEKVAFAPLPSLARSVRNASDVTKPPNFAIVDKQDLQKTSGTPHIRSTARNFKKIGSELQLQKSPLRSKSSAGREPWTNVGKDENISPDKNKSPASSVKTSEFDDSSLIRSKTRSFDKIGSNFQLHKSPLNSLESFVKKHGGFSNNEAKTDNLSVPEIFQTSPVSSFISPVRGNRPYLSGDQSSSKIDDLVEPDTFLPESIDYSQLEEDNQFYSLKKEKAEEMMIPCTHVTFNENVSDDSTAFVSTPSSCSASNGRSSKSSKNLSRFDRSSSRSRATQQEVDKKRKKRSKHFSSFTDQAPYPSGYIHSRQSKFEKDLKAEQQKGKRNRTRDCELKAHPSRPAVPLCTGNPRLHYQIVTHLSYRDPFCPYPITFHSVLSFFLLTGVVALLLYLLWLGDNLGSDAAVAVYRGAYYAFLLTGTLVLFFDAAVGKFIFKEL